MQASTDRSNGLKPFLSILTSEVEDHQRRVEIHLAGGGERNTVLQAVSPILIWIKRDLHDLL